MYARISPCSDSSPNRNVSFLNTPANFMDRRDGGAQLGKTGLHAAPEPGHEISRHLTSRKVSIAESSMFALANRVPTQGRHPVSVPAMDDRGDYPVPPSNV